MELSAAAIGGIVTGGLVIAKVIDKLVDAVLAKKNGKSVKTGTRALEKLSDRMVDMSISQQRISDNQTLIVSTLSQMDERFERTMNGCTNRLEKDFARLEGKVDAAL